jgi:hypothetical protein
MHRRVPRRPVLPALLLVVGLLSACGSTVASSSGQTAGGRSAEAEVLGGSADRYGGTAGPSAAGTAATANVVGSRSSGGTAPLAVTSPPDAAAALAGERATAEGGAVKVGFFITDDASAVYKSLGISGPSYTRDQSKALWGAVIEQVNARGGLGGRRIVPSYSFIDSESGTNASRAQAACEHFANDVKVFAVVIDGATDGAMATCLAKHRIVTVDVGQTSYPYDEVDLRELAPHLYLPGRLNMSRFATYIDRLEAAGFFASDSKIGLLRLDVANQARIRKDVIEPALRRHGRILTVEFAFTPVEGTGDLARAANEASAAVLQLRSKGVDRVLFLGSGLALPFVFPTAAESNGYRPRYGITSDEGPDFMASTAPEAQMSGAMAVGWEPQYDVADSDSVLAQSSVWRECAEVMRKAGFTPRDGRRCTAIYFLERGLQGAPGLTPETLRQGVDRIKRAAYSTQTYATFYGPGRFDGVGAVRMLRFQAECTCFRYISGDIPAS